ncbi:hypothetical protein FB567DRAFT_157917 [Paraphoma chrysanthemicola]|uniref:Uncharacterized protein n=1 Tax=Paraphoma chrysanthemicola TaxID=798071 RepID=A0A8K0QZA8_9PLEO|nr:hypothetical protein FB567DRAFT_157917 [Paraphoma chrysanthemicola]
MERVWQASRREIWDRGESGNKHAMKKFVINSCGIEILAVAFATILLMFEESCGPSSTGCLLSVRSVLYMTMHQHDSSQPQQSHDSPHERTGEGLMIEETEEATLPGMVMVEECSCGSCGAVRTLRSDRLRSLTCGGILWRQQRAETGVGWLVLGLVDVCEGGVMRES